MREIKFRAWDTLNKKFYKPFYECGFTGKSEELVFNMPNSRLGLHYGDGRRIDESMFPDRFVLEQYTGIKDKNGKEIYEGDIVVLMKYWRGVVKYEQDDCSFVICPFEVNQIQIELMKRQEQYIEVIGNIHDNHELLESKL